MDSFVTPRASSSSAPSPGAIDPLLCLRGIGKSYAAPVLQDVDLDLLPGEVHALMGANGAGKSTLACIISGLVQPDAGSMMLERSSYRPAGKAAAESLGVMKPVKPDQRLWYRRTFELAPPKQGQRWLLHFGAVDWDSTVIFNGRTLGTHGGGYDPFTFDITEAIAPSETQELVVSVWDPTDAGSQPRGKQVLKPGGIMYTANTGIWQTVWLEPVPETRIEALQIVPDLDAGEVRLSVKVAGGKAETQIVAWAFDGDREIAVAHGPASIPLGLKIREPKLWSPDQPFLYGLRVGIQGGDEVRSYFGMRKIALAKDESGINRLFLNGKPLFQLGPLDQGWWPDGLHTAPTDRALKYDLDITRQLGFNMIRKHVKVEPDRWYYWCDTMGILVWQDMPAGDNRSDTAKSRGPRVDRPRP